MANVNFDKPIKNVTVPTIQQGKDYLEGGDMLQNRWQVGYPDKVMKELRGKKGDKPTKGGMF